ncbi:sensor histidine kinase [Dyadobacter sp. CY312]|uniref:sensor histidine kinase n=1 Tax=Dyadobacter sp. CY312 TaxID=2907303 RepID=UPI001F213C20|nr:histidine kinase [Dyadobacter sp. CY312]MCE7041422.1 sensor histidine kinase [Dyadobacter sp. CY312]
MNELLMVKGKYIEHYISNNKRYHQFASHFLLIVLTWVISKYFAVGPYLNDNQLINNYFCLLVLLQTLFIYYFFSLFVFPKFLYPGKIIPFILILAASFLVLYWSNYLSINVLLPYSDAFKPNGPKDLWLVKIHTLLIEKAGWLGCFTSSRVAFWHFGFSFEIVTVYLAIKAFRDILAIQKKNLTLERDNLSLELNFLKSQINPHFLFNTLNSIYTRTVDVDEQASDIVLKLSDLMRYSLYGANEEKVPLEDEMAYIQNYLDLEKYRHSQNLVDISFAMDGTVTGYKIAPLLLISFVENAFKHGVNLSRKESFVHVSAVIEDSKLYFTVQNSLPDSNESASPKSDSKNAGIGLVNTRKRLEMIYPDRHEINIVQTEREYEVMLSIELT